jgi:hypothetical protein
MLDCFTDSARSLRDYRRNWLQGRDSNPRIEGHEPPDLDLLSTLRFWKNGAAGRTRTDVIALYKSAPVAAEGTAAKMVRMEGVAPSRHDGH